MWRLCSVQLKPSRAFTSSSFLFHNESPVTHHDQCIYDTVTEMFASRLAMKPYEANLSPLLQPAKVLKVGILFPTLWDLFSFAPILLSRLVSAYPIVD